MWTQGDHGWIAVADYKGRLVYASAAPRAVGADVRTLDAVARAYDVDERSASAMVVADDDPALLVAGLVERPGDGVVVVLAGAAVPGGTPRAVFVQGLDARRVLEDVAPPAGVSLALVTDAGRATGVVPPGVDTRRPPDGARAIGDWLVIGRPVAGPGDPAPIARVLLSRRLAGGLVAPLARLRPWIAVAAALLAATLALRGRRAWYPRPHG
jgi:hypothetical protein